MASNDEPIKLSKKTCWDEIGKYDMPELVKGLLRGLLSATFHAAITPTATASMIAMAKTHLIKGLQIDDRHYEIVVCVPLNPDVYRQSFHLREKPPHGTYKRLEEM